MRKSAWGVVVALCVIAVTCLCTAAAIAGDGRDGGQVIFGGQDQTICHHVEGNGNTGNGFNIETVSVDSIVKENGHAEHQGGQDIIPAFDYTKTVKGHGQDPDVTTNEHFPGQGDASLISTNCAAPPVDVCPNLEGNQSEIPDGYHMGEDENGRPGCVKDEEPPPPTDVCPNIEGDQSEVPDGYHIVEDENGRATCVQDEQPPTDVCPNLEGTQEQVPAGMVVDAQGNCVTPPPPPTHDCTPQNPDGSLGGKDGQPGNDDCAADQPPPSTPPSTPTTSTTPTSTPPATPPATQPPVVPPPAKVKPKAKPKTTPKPDKPKKAKPKTSSAVKHAHVCLTLKDGTKRAWWKGGNGLKPGCYAVVMGSG
jgi:hypothetical protein